MPYVNKMQVGDDVIDLTQDTVVASVLAKGYTAHKADGSPITGEYVEPTPTYDTPSISVSTGGLITASANGKSNTKQLATQSAKTVNPTESEQTAVATQTFTTGAVKVSAIPSDYIGSAVVIQRYYTGSTTPSSSLGNNGDLYLKA